MLKLFWGKNRVKNNTRKMTSVDLGGEPYILPQEKHGTFCVLNKQAKV